MRAKTGPPYWLTRIGASLGVALASHESEVSDYFSLIRAFISFAHHDVPFIAGAEAVDVSAPAVCVMQKK